MKKKTQERKEDWLTCLKIADATPNVHMRVGAEWSTAVQRCNVCRTSSTAGLSNRGTTSPRHRSAFTRTWSFTILDTYVVASRSLHSK
jgi:hypothetical protein